MLLHNFSNFSIECGTDEAGRGCLAGPVTAAAVILPNNITDTTTDEVVFFLQTINDSKQLSEKKREVLRPIIEKIAVSFAVTHIFPDEIDEINILNASLKGMQKSIVKLNPTPLYIIVDGNRSLLSKKGFYNASGEPFTEQEMDVLLQIPSTSIVKGDSKYLSIAAASVLAKTYRDEYMNALHNQFPMYNWQQNKGYPTQKHRESIQKFGLTVHHRKTFRGCF